MDQKDMYISKLNCFARRIDRVVTTDVCKEIRYRLHILFLISIKFKKIN